MMDHDLVLVTRTGSAGQSLADGLRRAGLDVSFCPPVRLAGPADPEATAARLLEWMPVDRIIMTSAEAIRQTIDLVGDERLADTPVIVPGPGSAATARALGLNRVVAPATAGNSEAMLELDELADARDKRVLVLAAAGGRRLLERVLRQRGAIVHRVHVYRRITMPLPGTLPAQVQAAKNPVTLIGSGGALKALKSGLDSATWDCLAAARMIVPSDRVRSMARSLGCSEVVKADGADDKAMLSALGGRHE